MGDTQEAVNALQKAADMRLNLLGDHEDTARSFHCLGVVQRKVRDLNGALESLQKAADMRSNLLGGHEDMALSLNELGEVRRNLRWLK